MSELIADAHEIAAEKRQRFALIDVVGDSNGQRIQPGRAHECVRILAIFADLLELGGPSGDRRDMGCCERHLDRHRITTSKHNDSKLPRRGVTLSSGAHQQLDERSEPRAQAARDRSTWQHRDVVWLTELVVQKIVCRYDQ